jgi:hypothetical protein
MTTRRGAVQSLERAGIARSAGMQMSGHLSSQMYDRYSIVDHGMLKEAASKLDAAHDGRPQPPKITPIGEAAGRK